MAQQRPVKITNGMIARIPPRVEPSKAKPRRWSSHRAWWCAVIVIIVLAGVTRWRLRGVPLERDEGEFAYAGQLILQGVAPYVGIYNMKWPGIYAAYAAILVLFGQTHSGIHVALLVINGGTAALLFVLGRRLFGPAAGVAAAAAFATLSLSQSVQGVFANAEHFVIICSTAGLVYVLRAVDMSKFGFVLLGGLLLGLGATMKQHGAAFVAMAVVWVAIDKLHPATRNWRELFVWCASLAMISCVPILVLCLVLLAWGALGQFWFWTFEYARQYVSQVSLSIGLDAFWDSGWRVVSSAWLIWIVATLGLVAVALDRSVRRRWPFMATFALFSLLAICPGFYFRPHYYVLTLPAAAVLFGAAVHVAIHQMERKLPSVAAHAIALMVGVLCIGAPLFQHRAYLFEWSTMEVARQMYGPNPFPESLEIAEYIRTHSDETDQVAVIGSEPQIYFYAQRRAATSYVYTYALMEQHTFAREMQDEMIRQIESAKPRYLVYVNIPTSWLRKPSSHGRIFEWFNQYHPQQYRVVGLAEIYKSGTRYQWAPQKIQSPRSQLFVVVMERKS